MHTFFVEPGALPGTTIALDREESAHAARVLRLRPGDEVRLIDGRGEAFSGRMQSVSAGDTRVEVDVIAPSRESRVRLTVYMGYPKADKLELIAQKLTELGAARLQPVDMRYSVAKGGGAKDARLSRIAREAAKQCGRALVPEIADAMSFADALVDMRKRQLLLMPWERACGYTLARALSERSDAVDVGLLIGPEGGISVEEADAVIAGGGLSVTLGERILRAETAAIASAAIVMALLS